VGMGGFDGNVLDHYTSELEGAGWTIEESGKARTSGASDVYRLLATKDWDVYMLELYVDQGASSIEQGSRDFFVTVGDG